MGSTTLTAQIGSSGETNVPLPYRLRTAVLVRLRSASRFTLVLIWTRLTRGGHLAAIDHPLKIILPRNLTRNKLEEFLPAHSHLVRHPGQKGAANLLFAEANYREPVVWFADACLARRPP